MRWGTHRPAGSTAIARRSVAEGSTTSRARAPCRSHLKASRHSPSPCPQLAIAFAVHRSPSPCRGGRPQQDQGWQPPPPREVVGEQDDCTLCACGSSRQAGHEYCANCWRERNKHSRSCSPRPLRPSQLQHHSASIHACTELTDVTTCVSLTLVCSFSHGHLSWSQAGAAQSPQDCGSGRRPECPCVSCGVPVQCSIGHRQGRGHGRRGGGVTAQATTYAYTWS